MSGSACNAYQIRKIYAIGGALGMVKRGEDDDLLHELVNGMTGKTSIKELTYGEACKVIGELEGRQGTPPPRKSGRPLHKSVPGRTSEGQRRKIWALMYQLQAASPSKAQIGDRLCKRQISDIQKTYTTREQHQRDWGECRNDIKSIRSNFLTKEDYFREQAKTEKKLDRILDLLMKRGTADE